MYSIFIFFFVLIALSNAQENDDCSEDAVKERIDDCVFNLLIPDLTNEETCEEIKATENCLKIVFDECFLGEEQISEASEFFQNKKTFLKSNCSKIDDEVCAEDNKVYLIECIPVSHSYALAQLGENADQDQSRFKCTLYSLIVNCITQRVEEKCGETARDIFKENLEDPPQEIKDACDDADDIVLIQNQHSTQEIEACAADNKEYFTECLAEHHLNALAQFGNNTDQEQNRLKCALYSLIADCVTERVVEKCGETARDLIREKLNDPPQEVTDACDAAEEIHLDDLDDFESLLK